MGDTLDWHAPWERVVLWVELPFWLMVPDCSLDIAASGHTYKVDVCSDFSELHAYQYSDSKSSCFYVGRSLARLRPSLAEQVDAEAIPVVARKCKTVLRIYSRCNSDAVLAASTAGHPRRSSDAATYLRSLCIAHLDVVNDLVQHYRLATYDYFPHVLSPWDVPTWIVDTSQGFLRTGLMPDASWDRKPHVISAGGVG